MMSKWRCGRFELDLSKPLVMGILNTTPDSFSDGGKYNNQVSVLAKALQMKEQGVDILDIGGESTRPGAPFVSVEEEWSRVAPALEVLQDLNLPLSLDTRRAEIMQRALKRGNLDIVNDVSALEDSHAIEVLQTSQVGICLMHKQGNPQTMQISPNYGNVVLEVANYLKARVDVCVQAGIDLQRIVVDPGFGFGKSLEHNLDLLKNLSQINEITQRPILVGISRKSMLGAWCDEAEPELRLGASVTAAYEAMRLGAKIVRVHDVRETHQARQLYDVWYGK